ncbi:hypothetical protein BLAT2472_30677 [Burkholderia latens]
MAPARAREVERLRRDHRAAAELGRHWPRAVAEDEGRPEEGLRRRAAQFAAICPSDRGDREARVCGSCAIPRRPGLLQGAGRATDRRLVYRQARGRGQSEGAVGHEERTARARYVDAGESGDDALLGRRQVGQRGVEHVHDQRLFRLGRDRRRHRDRAQRRDGRLFREARRREHVRRGRQRRERDRAEEAPAVVDVADDPDEGRQGVARDRHAGRFADFHVDLPGDQQRVRLQDAAEGRRRRDAVPPPAAAAQHDLLGAVPPDRRRAREADRGARLYAEGAGLQRRHPGDQDRRQDAGGDGRSARARGDADHPVMGQARCAAAAAAAQTAIDAGRAPGIFRAGAASCRCVDA